MNKQTPKSRQQFEHVTPNGFTTSVLAQSYETSQHTIVLFIETDDNHGTSAVNCIESLSEAFQKLHLETGDPNKPIKWIVCNANTYSPKPEPAEYAEWGRGDGWKWLSRAALAAETADEHLPEYRGELNRWT